MRVGRKLFHLIRWGHGEKEQTDKAIEPAGKVQLAAMPVSVARGASV